MSDTPLLKRASLAEACDAMVLPPPAHRALFVLPGRKGPLRAESWLAQPRDFSINLKMVEGRREYLPDPMEFSTLPGNASTRVDLLEADLYRFDTEQHDYFRVYFVCSSAAHAREVETRLTALAFEAASTLNDWRLENALEWCATQRRAAAGELQPDTGFALPAPLRWRLRRPVFRAGQHGVHYLWEIASAADTAQQQRPVISCVTDNLGAVTRKADLVPIQRMFARPAAAPAAAPARAPVDFSIDPVLSRPDADEEIARLPPAAEKVLPQFRRQKLAEKQQADAEAQKEKIRRLFEMS